MIQPTIKLDKATVYHGSCIDVLKQLPENSIDSIVTDPPYGLEFMGKDWDAPWKAEGFKGNVEPTATSAGGVEAYSRSRVRYHKGQQQMVLFQKWCEEWAVETFRVLKPGGYILAFGGSRTWHRLAVAIEDAGYEIRDSIAWIYGSGFPKSQNISIALDKSAKAMDHRGVRFENAGLNRQGIDVPNPTGAERHQPITDEAKKWEGWGTALKPAFEPVVMARKPLIGTVVKNILTYGTGGINIDDSRIGSSGGTQASQTFPNSETVSAYGNGLNGNKKPVPTGEGRWPANVMFAHTVECVQISEGTIESVPAEEVSGGIWKESTGKPAGPTYNETPAVWECPEWCPVWELDQQGDASRFFYVSKASKRDRNEGLDEVEEQSLGAKGNGLNRSCESCGKRQLEGCECPNPTFVNPTAKNFHPTVKPTQLMRYLIRLVTPPGGTVLDPFTGSGSTGKAALLEKFNFVGIELTEDYLPIIEGRLRFAENKAAETLLGDVE